MKNLHKIIICFIVLLISGNVLFAASPLKTEHFRIICFGGELGEGKLKEIARLLESCYSEVSASLGITAYASGKLEVRVFPEDEGRAKARRWGSVIKLYANRYSASTIRHELTHIMIDKYLPGAPRWFHEGVAQYMGQGKGGLENLPPFPGKFSFDRLEANFKNVKQEHNAYYYSWAVISYLADKYGKERLKGMFAEHGGFKKRFARAYGVDLKDVEKTFRNKFAK